MPHLDQRRAELLRRRLVGDDFATLARELDYIDAAEAAAAFTQALTDTEPLEDAARDEADRRALDELQHAIWDQAASGDLDVIDTTLAIHDRRVRRLGLNAVAHLLAEGPAPSPAAVTDAELDELLALIEDPPT
ncbi:hypothetical protein ACFC0S_16390 [Streptomyces sp. NPDC056084]|uniref:hypothetical protein n=1 Tax=unclassified Streptomyces TaxID=2593676 RepID=UPI0035E29A69